LIPSGSIMCSIRAWPFLGHLSSASYVFCATRKRWRLACPSCLSSLRRLSNGDKLSTAKVSH